MMNNFWYFFVKNFDQGLKYIFWHFYRHLLVNAFVVGIFMISDMLRGQDGRYRLFYMLRNSWNLPFYIVMHFFMLCKIQDKNILKGVYRYNQIYFVPDPNNHFYSIAVPWAVFRTLQTSMMDIFAGSKICLCIYPVFLHKLQWNTGKH